MFKQLIEFLTVIINRLIPSDESRLKRMELNEKKIRQKSINRSEKLSIKYEKIKRKKERIKKRIETRKSKNK